MLGLLLIHNYLEQHLPHSSPHTFPTTLLSPPCSFSLQSLSNGDRWPAASCCLVGLNSPLLSPAPLVYCNWWLGCRDSHGIAMWALSHSLLAEGLWGGRGGKQCEMVGAAREGGLLLTEEKCCRLSRKDNCTEFVMWSCVYVRVCCRCAMMRASLFSCMLLCFCVRVISSGLVPAWGTVLCCVASQTTTVQRRTICAGKHGDKHKRGGRTDLWANPELPVSTAVQSFVHLLA